MDRRGSGPIIDEGLSEIEKQTRLNKQKEYEHEKRFYVSYIFYVCSLYVTFLLPPERAPKVLAPSLFSNFL